MIINRTQLTEEERKLKLQKVTARADVKKMVKVCIPVSLEAENSDLFLSGYRHDDPVSFNVTDYFQPGQSDHAKYPFFKDLGTEMIGYFLGGKTLDIISSETGRPVGEWMLSEPVDAIRYIRKTFDLSAEFSETPFIAGFRENEKMFCYVYFDDGFHNCETEPYALSLDVFSRNTGILETGMMKSMTAIISGCGSVGSYVALELARSGVGRFLLIDNDVIGYTNICRHQCGISDVGRYKTQAVADRIRLINPEAEIGTQNSVVENVPPAVFEKFCGPSSIIIGCADNREGDLFTCKIAAHYRMPMVSIGFWERAFAGEVFYWIPEKEDLACYKCFTAALGDISGRQSVNRRFYTTETDLSKVNFMPGISVDIIFVTNIGTKIILDILNRNNDKFIPRLLDSLSQFTLIANTNKQEVGGAQAGIFSYPLQVTTSITVEKTADCKYCNKNHQ